ADKHYRRMVHKKTSHYSFIAPMLVGAVVGEASASVLGRLRFFATLLGTAFQIQDDVLNLTGSEDRIGKEIDGDLWEGKHTLILLHAVRSGSHCERERALRVLQKPRSRARTGGDSLLAVSELVQRLVRDGKIERLAALEV